MHPLSIFPELLTYGLLAPFLLRLIVGYLILCLGWTRYKKPYKWTTVLYAVFGVMLIIGLYTQIIAIVSIILLKFDYYVDFYKDRKSTPVPKMVTFLYVMAILILLSLLFTGPGAYAFDLPL